MLSSSFLCRAAHNLSQSFTCTLLRVKKMMPCLLVSVLMLWTSVPFKVCLLTQFSHFCALFLVILMFKQRCMQKSLLFLRTRRLICPTQKMHVQINFVQTMTYSAAGHEFSVNIYQQCSKSRKKEELADLYVELHRKC